MFTTSYAGTLDRRSLRLSAALLSTGEVVFIMAGLLHPGGGNQNNHVFAFTEYANSAYWTLIHTGQFAGIGIIIFGLLALFFALDVNSGIVGKASRFAAASAVVTLALYGVLQAVDGVALKQAVDAWVSAPTVEQLARFAVAEGIRWLEWGVRSYQEYMLGLSLILFAIVIVSTARIPRPIGYLMGLSGLDYFVLGYMIGSGGFSPALLVPGALAFLFDISWIILLVISAWRVKVSV